MCALTPPLSLIILEVRKVDEVERRKKNHEYIKFVMVRTFFFFFFKTRDWDPVLPIKQQKINKHSPYIMVKTALFQRFSLLDLPPWLMY